MEDRGEKRRDVVCLDDAAGAPDLHDVVEVDAPFILLVCYIDDAYALNVSSEASRVDCQTEVFDECILFFFGGEREFLGEEGSVEGFRDMFSLSPEGRNDA